LATSFVVHTFHKYEGLGNDFALIEVDHVEAFSLEVARRLCDRRRGIGADGVLLIERVAQNPERARMRVVNADGSVPEMCGNGLRCVALHLARQASVVDIVVDTDAGPRECHIERRAEGVLIRATMGIVRVLGEASLLVSGDPEPWAVTLVDAGNPHAVTLRPATRDVIERVGLPLATHSQLPNGANVEFATFREDKTVDVVVWERGVGLTLACGTGACATVAAGVSKGLVVPGECITVRLPGGALDVCVMADGQTFMTGPARHVFSGEVAL
jgi:diaminopimelate epimerase